MPPGRRADDPPRTVDAAARPARPSWARQPGPARADTQVGGDEPLFADGRSPRTCRGSPCRHRPERQSGRSTSAPAAGAEPSAADVEPAGERLGPDVLGPARPRRRRSTARTAPPGRSRGGRLDAVLPWFAHDALVHYLRRAGWSSSPAARWGTRDVCQGPVGLLLALGRPGRRCATCCCASSRAQNARGDWPQAFDFLAATCPSGPAGLARRRRLLAAARRSATTSRTTGDATPARRGRALRRRRRPDASRRRSPSTSGVRSTRIDGVHGPRAPRCRHTATATGTTRCSRPTRSWPPHLVLDLDGGAAGAGAAHASPTGLHAVGAPGRRPRPAGRRRRRARRAHPTTRCVDSCSPTRCCRATCCTHDDGRLEPLVHPTRRADRAALRRAAVDPRDRRRPADAGAGAPPPRPHRASTCSARTARGSSTGRSATSAAR